MVKETPLSVLMLSTHDNRGGAARSAYRLHLAQTTIGLDSKMLVREKSTTHPTVLSVNSMLSRRARLSFKFSQMRETHALRTYPKRIKEPWHVANASNSIASLVNKLNPDVIYMHWIWSGYVPITAISQYNAPVIWKMPDSSPFTGGCHVSYDCLRFQEQCGRCPKLRSDQENDLSRKTWLNKRKAWKSLDFTAVAASHWLAERARSSSLFAGRDIRVIPNGMDLNEFRPIEKELARKVLRLPSDKKLILFGAIKGVQSYNKGGHLLEQCVDHLADKWQDSLELVIFGSDAQESQQQFQLPAHYLGHLNDTTTIVLAYSAADLMIVPSLQEAFGQTASEALACGTPVVAFGATGLLDVITHEADGYLAEPYDSKDLAYGVDRLLTDDELRQAMILNARKKAVENFDIYKIAEEYRALYLEKVGLSQ